MRPRIQNINILFKFRIGLQVSCLDLFVFEKIPSIKNMIFKQQRRCDVSYVYTVLIHFPDILNIFIIQFFFHL